MTLTVAKFSETLQLSTDRALYLHQSSARADSASDHGFIESALALPRNLLAETIELGVGESGLQTVLLARSTFEPEHYQMPGFTYHGPWTYFCGRLVFLTLFLHQHSFSCSSSVNQEAAYLLKWSSDQPPL